MGRPKKEFVDLTGKQFGLWTVIRQAEPKADSSGREYEMWTCRCSCEKHTEKDIYVQHLIHGNSKSCGCLLKKAGDRFRTHGKTETRLYNIWSCMKRRCNSSKNPAYPRYGGRGISVCEEWARDFSVFEEWAMNNGYSDQLTIDRIDVNGNYEPSNCRWATYKEQANNTRANRIIHVDGKALTAPQWSELFGVPAYQILFRIYHGWTEEAAVKTPLHQKAI